MSPEKQITIYDPPQEIVEQGCASYQAVHESGERVEHVFGKTVAESKLLDHAISQGMDAVPDPSDDGELWELRKEQVELGQVALSECVDCPILPYCPGGKTIENIAGSFQTDYETLRRGKQEEVALAISEQIEDAILKGGFAAIQHGLERTTDDLDYDLLKPLTTSQRQRVEAIVEAVGGKIEPKKDTDTTVRYMVPLELQNMGQDKPMKLEFRTLDEQPDEDTITTVNGIRTYTVDKLFANKASTFLSRSKSRDIVDLSYLLYKSPDALKGISDEQLIGMSDKICPSDGTKDILDLNLVRNMVGVPAWINEDIAEQMLRQLSAKVDQEMSARVGV